MLPLTYEPGFGNPQRLSGRTQARGARTGMSTGGGLVFGGVFVAVGTFIVLLGLRVIEPGGRLHVPHAVLIPAGAAFSLAGLFVWGNVWRQHRAERRHTQMRAWHPEEPALADHPWDPAGSHSQLRQHAVKATLLAIFFILFLTPGNYIVFHENAPWFARGGVVLFDLITLYLLFDAGLRWGRALKFGRAVLRFERFPYRTREPVKLIWIAPVGCDGEATGRFTLRAVREWYETTGSRKSRNTQLVHEQLWAGTWKLESPARIAAGEPCELTFTLPPDAPSTAMHAERPLFWELEVALSLPGLDFTDTYLVPIYGQKRE